MKKLVYLFISVFVFFLSCTSENKIQQNDLNKDKNTIVLLNICDDILMRMKSVDINDLEAAVASDDEERINALLGLSQSDVLELKSKMDVAVSNLINDYPEVNEMLDKMEKGECKKCQSNKKNSIELLKQNNFRPISLDIQPLTKTDSESGSGSGCHDSTSYTFCCIACAAAPVTVWAYPACVYACYLAFC